MAYNPISGAAIQYVTSAGNVASGYYLKFYTANTTTPLSMATDATGGSGSYTERYVPLVGTSATTDTGTDEDELPDNDDLAPQVHGGQFMTYGGTANAITLTSVNTVALTAVTTGDLFRFRATATNTGATTIDPDGIAAVACLTVTGAALPADYIRTDVDTICTYDGTNYIVSRAVENGTNSEGQFTRWENGGQEVTRADTVAIAIATVLGSVFTSANFGSSLFAKPFTSVYYTNIDAFSASNNTCWIGNHTTDPTLTNFGDHRFFDATSTASEDYEVSQIAKGKWY
jgi:hypothetical protein